MVASDACAIDVAASHIPKSSHLNIGTILLLHEARVPVS
jgi:hypothetical protein